MIKAELSQMSLDLQTNCSLECSRYFVLQTGLKKCPEHLSQMGWRLQRDFLLRVGHFRITNSTASLLNIIISLLNWASPNSFKSPANPT